MARSSGALYIADTNNGAVRVLDPVTLKLATLDLSSVPRIAQPSPLVVDAAGPPPGAAVVKAGAVADASGEVVLNIALPPGYHYTVGAPSRFVASVEPADATATASPDKGPLVEKGARVAFSRSGTGPALLRVTASIYFCRDGGACLFETVSFEVPLQEGGRVYGGAPVVLDYAPSVRAPEVAFP